MEQKLYMLTKLANAVSGEIADLGIVSCTTRELMRNYKNDGKIFAMAAEVIGFSPISKEFKSWVVNNNVEVILINTSGKDSNLPKNFVEISSATSIVEMANAIRVYLKENPITVHKESPSQEQEEKESVSLAKQPEPVMKEALEDNTEMQEEQEPEKTALEEYKEARRKVEVEVAEATEEEHIDDDGEPVSYENYNYFAMSGIEAYELLKENKANAPVQSNTNNPANQIDTTYEVGSYLVDGTRVSFPLYIKYKEWSEMCEQVKGETQAQRFLRWYTKVQSAAIKYLFNQESLAEVDIESTIADHLSKQFEEFKVYQQETTSSVLEIIKELTVMKKHNIDLKEEIQLMRDRLAEYGKLFQEFLEEEEVKNRNFENEIQEYLQECQADNPAIQSNFSTKRKSALERVRELSAKAGVKNV